MLHRQADVCGGSHPQEVGIFQEVDSGSKITTETVMHRIMDQHEVYTKRNSVRSVIEDTYKEQKKYVTEQ
jgi:hypothetical protein